MAQQIINLGIGANTGTGDKARTAFGKVNANFTDLYADLNSANVLFGQYARLDGAAFTGAVSFAETPTVGGTPFSPVSLSGSYTDLIHAPNLATVALTGTYGDLIDTPALSDVALSGNYSDLSGKPVLFSVALSGRYSDLSGTPVLSMVALSGSYADLSDKPFIPTPQVNSDWDATAGIAQILNKPLTWDWSNLTRVPDFSAVALTGNYGDLIGNPVLSTVASSGSYVDLLNAPSLSAVALSGRYSDLSGTPVLSMVALSGSYADLSDKPFIPAAPVNSDWDATTGIAQILNKPLTWDWSHLTNVPVFSEVAISGKYSDLLNAPTLAAVASSGEYSDLLGKPTTWDWSNLTSVPNFSTVSTSGSYSDLSDKPSLASIALSGSASDLTTGTLPLSVLPAGIADGISFVTLWDASTNTPPLSPGVGTKGQFFKVSVSGSTNLDDITQWNAGDMALFDGSKWGKIHGVASEVLSVNTQVGAVVLTKSDIGLPNVQNVDTTIAANISGLDIYALLSGSDFTGNVRFGSGINLEGSSKVITFQNSASAPRWAVAQNTSAETGGNAGSDFSIERYNDAGLPIDSPLSIDRSTGRVSFSQAPIINGTVVATVATSGSYADLSNKPFIPTKVSQIANDSGFLSTVSASIITTGTLPVNVLPSSVVLNTQLAPVATSGSYVDLTHTPTIPTMMSQLINDSGYLSSVSYPVLSVNGQTGIVAIGKAAIGLSNVQNVDTTNASNITSGTLSTSLFPSSVVLSSTLAAVASSGSYTSLINTPFIPSKVSQLTNDSGYVTVGEINNPITSVNGQLGIVVLGKTDIGLGNVSNIDTTNAANITSGTLADSRLSSNIPRISTLSTMVVTSINGANGAINLSSGSVGLGNVPNVNATIATNITSGTLPLSVIPITVARTSSLSAVALSGSYADLTNAPSIPSATSQITNNSGFITNSNQNLYLNNASGSKRWSLVSDASNETGFNQGSNFSLNRYDDASALIDSPFSFVRSTGVATFAQTPYVNTNSIWHAGNFNPSNYALVGSGATFGGAISSPGVTITGANGTLRPLYYQTSGINRWNISASEDLESVSNVGSNLLFERYNDNGNYLDTPLSVNRSTGLTNFSQMPTVGGVSMASTFDSAGSAAAANANIGVIAPVKVLAYLSSIPSGYTTLPVLNSHQCVVGDRVFVSCSGNNLFSGIYVFGAWNGVQYPLTLSPEMLSMQPGTMVYVGPTDSIYRGYNILLMSSPYVWGTTSATWQVNGLTLVQLGGLATTNNLSDLTSASTARTNLGLGSAATMASSAFDLEGAATAAQAAAQAYTQARTATTVPTTANNGEVMQVVGGVWTISSLDITASINAVLPDPSFISNGAVLMVENGSYVANPFFGPIQSWPALV